MFKDRYHTEESKKKMRGRIPWNKNKKGIHLSPKSEFRKGHPATNGVFQKGIKPWNKGIKTGIIPKRAFQKGNPSYMKGKHHTEKSKQKISKTKKKNPTRFWLDKKFSDKHRKNLSKTHKGKKLPEGQKRKIGEANKGEKHWNWQNGISFEPYSIDWTETLKRAIRERDHYACQVCGKEPAICVHHIDYNKKNCNPENLITLCLECHLQTNKNRGYWINYFMKITSI